MSVFLIFAGVLGVVLLEMFGIPVILVRTLTGKRCLTGRAELKIIKHALTHKECRAQEGVMKEVRDKGNDTCDGGGHINDDTTEQCESVVNVP